MQDSRRLQLLIAEDSPVVRDRLVAMAREHLPAESIATAGNGAEALAVFDRSDPDAVLLDIGLPDMSGLRVLEHIRRQGTSTEVVVFTNSSGPEMVARCHQLGANHFVDKAHDIRPVIESLRTITAPEQRSSRITPPASPPPLCDAIGLPHRLNRSNPVSVLVVEDDASQADPLLKLLRRKLPQGSSVAHAGSQAEALECVLNGKFDVVLLDLGLPDCEGAEAVVALRAASAELAIIVLSAEEEESTVQSAMECGADDYFVKGELAVSGVVRAVTFAVERKRSARALTTALESRRRIMDSSLDVICTLDAAGRFAEVGAACERAWGYTREELLGHDCTEWIAPADQTETQRVLDAVRGGAPAGGFENRLVRKDGVEVATRWSAVWSATDRLMYCVARDITERKRQDETLRATIESALDCIITIDESDTILEFNPAAEQTFGWSRAEAIGRTLSGTIIPPQFREGHARGMARVLSGGELRLIGKRIEITALRADGVEFPVELTIVQVGTDGPRRFTAFLRDITERVAAREKLEAQEEQYRVLFETNPSAMWVYELETLRFLAVNGAAVEQYGYSRDEFLARSLFDLRAPTDAEALRKAVSTQGAPSRHAGTWPHRRKDGSTIFVDVYSSPTDFEGTPARIAVLVDVTERKQAEATRFEREQEFEALVENAPDVISRYDRNLRHLYVNRVVAQATGLPASAFIGKTHEEMGMPRHLLAEWLAVLEDVFASGKERDTEFEFPTPGGPRFYLSRLVPEHAPDGRIRSVLNIARDITERKQAEEALRKSEASLAAAQKRAKIGNWEMNLVNRTATWSTEMFRIFQRDQSLGAPPFAEGIEKIYPEDRESFQRSFDQAIKDRRELKDDVRIFRSDGDIRWLELRGEVICDEAGQPIRMIGTSQDITERKQADVKLRASAAALALAQQVAHLGSWELELDNLEDVNSNVLRWSEETFRIFGYQPGEIEVTCGAFFQMVHPDDRERVTPSVSELLRAGTRYSLDHRIVLSNGAIRVVHEEASLIVDEKTKRPIKVAGTVQDITPRKAAEEKLREQAEMLNLAHDAIAIRGYDDRIITYWNKGAERLYGWTAKEAIGQPVDFLYDGRSDNEAAKQTLEASGEFQGEVHQVAKDGRSVTVNVRANLMRKSDGTPRAVLSIATDITEHKKLESQFLRAQRLESIGTLASGVAHDLNNILSPILMSVPLLRTPLSDEGREKILSLVEQSAERGAAVVKQVLTFARGADGEKVLVQPTYLVKEIAQIAQETFPNNITVRSGCPDDLWLISGDATELHQVLLNLCVNARDAMPEGGSLSITAENFEVDAHYASMMAGAHAGAHVLLTVSDTGTGIPPQVIEKIFDPFFTTKQAGKGTGLGLSTVLGIVKSHGGVVNAYSTAKGTTFRVLLPAAPGAHQASAAADPGDLPRGQGETILIVDDEPLIREVAQALLEHSGYIVLTADDGPAALAIFARRSAEIRLVMTDFAMPLMSGMTLARALRKMDASTKIIVSTGRDEDCNPAEAKSIGIEATLAKPYTQEKLLRTLDRLLHAAAVGP